MIDGPFSMFNTYGVRFRFGYFWHSLIITPRSARTKADHDTQLAELAAGEPKSVFWDISSKDWEDYAKPESSVLDKGIDRMYDVLVEELRVCRKKTSNSETFQEYLFHLLGGFRI